MSTLRADTIADRAGTGPATLTDQVPAKVWCTFDGTGTAAIRDDFNVATLTDNGTGDYDLDYNNNFANNDYACNVTHESTLANSNGGVKGNTIPATGSVDVFGHSTSGFADMILHNAIHGDLA